VNSAAVQSFYQKKGIPPDKISLVPAGVPPAPNPTIDRSQLLSQRSLPPDAKLIAYLGPLAKHKRLKDLIWAVDQLKAVGLCVHLFVAGDGSLRTMLERYARQNRVQDRVHFLGLRTDIGDWLPNVDLLWQGGYCEGQSQAILEAMAAGVPVV